MTAIHDDVDRRHRSHEVAVQATLIRDRSRYLLSNAIIHWGRRQYLNLIVDRVYAFNPFYRVLSIFLQRRIYYGAEQGNGVPVHGILKIIEQ